MRNLTRGMVAQLQEQAQVAVAAAKYVDEAANGVDSIAQELSRASATQVQEAAPTDEAVPTEEEGATSCH